MPIRLKYLLVIIFTIGISGFCYAKTNDFSCEYNIVGESVAREGSYIVNVSVIVKKKNEATSETVKQYALLGCLYKGFIVDRISQKPMITNSLETKEQMHIQNLILNQYGTFTDLISSLQIIKVGKKYRVSAVILVAKDALRQNLEKEGIIRKLGL